ncbi:MAG: CaiB/BaiF CoA-transferase family protein [Alphaproteobacteria bacterium]|jgi:alpha-methylacyl-CoA racemase|nr:CaiB/BaiF CoA-transferase family protein [Alphaproteobacteria bacterium]MDP6812191.1 CaiB/BaiF CoA-transferase family protein [Alphaproteobacteria bacterium]
MGPLAGVRIVEFAGIGPGPFCGMMLSDMGAEVIRVDRPGTPSDAPKDALSRGRKSLALNLKHPGAVDVALRLLASADGLIEGFRPGVMERLGLGPEVCLGRNPRLVYGRMTGWGQDGPLAGAAGHDTNYIALAGVLHTIGPKGRPPVMPLNLIGDFGGGGLLLAFGMACALFEARASGRGQVVDAAMVDGAATLASVIFARHSQGAYVDERESNILDGGSHFARAYETKDGRHISIVSLEPQFYDLLLEKLGLDKDRFAEQMSRERWPEYTEELEAIFKSKSRDEWCEILEGTDVCFAPVLSLAEAPRHPHNLARRTFVEHDGFLQAAPSPRFSRTAAGIQSASRAAGADTEEVLDGLGYGGEEMAALSDAGAIAFAD